MRRVLWTVLAAVPLAIVGGVVYGNAMGGSSQERAQAQAGSFTCPMTGEQLPCPNCCPMNR